MAVSDAVDLLSGSVIQSGIVKAVLEEVDRIEELHASVDGMAPVRLETFLVDPVPMRYEVNIHLPSGLAPGVHKLEVGLKQRVFPPIVIETRS